jgi:hypothetical protein
MVEVIRFGREPFKGRLVGFVLGRFVAEDSMSICRDWFDAAERFDAEHLRAAVEHGDAYHPAWNDWQGIIAGMTPHIRVPELGGRVEEFQYTHDKQVEVYFTEAESS